jgi:hypothetical protein
MIYIKYVPQTLLSWPAINPHGKKTDVFNALPACIVARKKRYNTRSEQRKETGM